MPPSRVLTESRGMMVAVQSALWLNVTIRLGSAWRQGRYADPLAGLDDLPGCLQSWIESNRDPRYGSAGGGRETARFPSDDAREPADERGQPRRNRRHLDQLPAPDWRST